MNRNNSPAKQLWAHQPLQSYSRSATDSHERTAILSPVQPVEPRLKRSRVSNHEGHEESRSTSSNRSKLTPSKPSAGSVGGAFENNGNSETQHVENEMPFKPTLKMQPLSLDRGAIAPGLVRATAPFAKSERKRAYVSAIYYSECFLRGIKPVDADMAAVDIQNQYSKWWVQSKNDSKKKRKRDSSDANIATPSSSTETRKTVEELSNQDQTPTLDEDQIIELKRRLFENLQKTGGDTTNSEFKAYCEQLTTIYKTNSRQRSSERFCQDGTWLPLSKPTFTECQGRNENGEYMYTLGRMSFDMFRPTHLKCSIRAVMNNIRVMDPKTKPKSFPSRLAKELQQNVSAPENPIQHYE